MDYVLNLYNNNNLIARAMDLPNLRRANDNTVFDCSTWINEFELMERNMFTSVSSTLLVPNVPVKTYKNVGYLVDSNIAECFHFCKTDSGSSGNISNGDFAANQSDFNSLEELADFIVKNNHGEMNEINMNLPPEAVVGLFINRCPNERFLLKGLIPTISALKKRFGIDLPLYEYDQSQGLLTKIELTEDLINEIMNGQPENNIDEYYYYSEFDDEEHIGNIFDDAVKMHM